MNLVKNLLKTTKCPICKKNKFKNLGKVNIAHPDLKNLLFLLECLFCNHLFYSKMPSEKYLNYLGFFFTK